MKVEEAKTKVCPFIQHLCLATGVGSHAMTPYSHLNINCIADECMAWEWAGETKDNGYGAKCLTGKLSTTQGYCKRLEK